jgi:hypothetical protein
MTNCALNCAPNYAHGVHSRGAARPRKHWGFGCTPSPTTRPPRIPRNGGFRVVGLGVCWGWELAGAGGI